MPIAALIPLITALAPLGIQGLALITSLIQKWETSGAVSSIEWQGILDKSSQTADDRMLLALKANGVDPTSPTGIALLAVTK